jgi:hypothetical protein
VAAMRRAVSWLSSWPPIAAPAYPQEIYANCCPL